MFLIFLVTLMITNWHIDLTAVALVEEFYDKHLQGLFPLPNGHRMSKEQFVERFYEILLDVPLPTWVKVTSVDVTPEDPAQLSNPEFSSLTAKCPLTGKARWELMGLDPPAMDDDQDQLLQEVVADLERAEDDEDDDAADTGL